ncbi:hypothetical protein B0H14DRAFT_3164729 [Mycena olivaceomarginata]|nr:hypothetical protein B0H14DRAFT_3164729 [Mycena olivaceomarginata]
MARECLLRHKATQPRCVSRRTDGKRGRQSSKPKLLLMRTSNMDALWLKRVAGAQLMSLSFGRRRAPCAPATYRGAKRVWENDPGRLVFAQNLSAEIQARQLLTLFWISSSTGASFALNEGETDQVFKLWLRIPTGFGARYRPVPLQGWGMEGYGYGSARGRPAGDPCTSLFKSKTIRMLESQESWEVGEESLTLQARCVRPNTGNDSGFVQYGKSP